MCTSMSKPAFETYWLLFCMKSVAKLIIGVRVSVGVGLHSSHYAVHSSHYAVHSSHYAVNSSLYAVHSSLYAVHSSHYAVNS